MINTAFVPKYSTAKIATRNEQVFSLFPQFLSIFGIFVILILAPVGGAKETTSSTSLFNNHGIFADAPEPWQYGFQDPATPVMEGIVDLHHDICFFLILIIVFVLWMLSRTVFYFVDSGQIGAQVQPATPEKIIHGTTIEIAWTIAPSIILVLIAIPSFALLYSLDEIVDPAITIKAIGHQWYWS